MSGSKPKQKKSVSNDVGREHICKHCGLIKIESKMTRQTRRYKNKIYYYFYNCKSCANIIRGKYHYDYDRKEYQKRWYLENREEIYRRRKIRFKEDPDAARRNNSYSREWHRLHQSEIHSRRDFAGNRETVIKRDEERCLHCGMLRSEHREEYGRDITVDHIDGNRKNNDLSNLQTLCLRCHGKKDITRRKIRPVYA